MSTEVSQHQELILATPQSPSSGQSIRAFLQLTKPSIMLLVLVTGATALVLEGSFLQQPLKFAFVLFGLYLTGGSANALNQYFERDIDARMSRTRSRRPLPRGLIRPTPALVFSVSIGVAGVALFWIIFNPLTAALALGTILFYSLVYTLLLKPTTAQNIVIGGAAGAMAPVGAWTAATGEFALMPWAIFLIVFLWTPPHFWALALFCKEDYRAVGYPMLPVLKGDRTTYNQMLIYSVLLAGASLLPLLDGATWLYGGAATVVSGALLRKVWQARAEMTERLARRVFGFSIVYLFALCAALAADSMLQRLLL